MYVHSFWCDELAVAVVSKYEDKDLDFRYIVQKAGIMDKVSIEKKVNPTRSGGSDKGRSVALDENEACRIMRLCQKSSKFQAILVPC